MHRALKINPVACWKDNYAYVLYKNSRVIAFVDPVEPLKLLKDVEQELGLSHNDAIAAAKDAVLLTTHHHDDHSSGNTLMADLVKGIKVYGHKDEAIPEMNSPLVDGQSFSVQGVTIQALHTPPHTANHLCYYVTADEDKAVFTGDCLFIAGSGYINEGTVDQMYASIVGKLSKLPADTKVYVGHEYTMTNLKFAQTIEPQNKDIQQLIDQIKQVSVPSSIKQELLINPYMRVTHQHIREKVKAATEVEAIGIIRQMKNDWKQ